MTRRIGLLGGTFDPVHRGHLAAGLAAQRALALDEVRLMPLRVPPHRPQPPRASTFHRFAMAALVALDQPGWTASDLELLRDGPSYTFDTLAAMHDAGLAATQIFCLTGADAFAEIATWSRYPAVLELAHFVVVTRPGTSLDAAVAHLPDVAPRLAAPAAACDTDVTRVVCLAAETPDVSSTGIRRRAAAGAALAGLVTPAVEQYILRHGLYRPSPLSVDEPLHGQDR